MSIKKLVFAAFVALGCFAISSADEGTVHDAALAGAGWKYDAMIVAAKDQESKSMFSSRDTVYLNEGTEGGLTPGVQCIIYRSGDEAKDPETGKSMGSELRRVGTMEITEDVSSHHASGLILDSTEPIEIGDVVKKE